MSAPRLWLHITRAAPLVAFATLSLIAACTKPTPNYCDVPSDCASHNCLRNIHTCGTADAAGDAGATADAPADAPTDSEMTGDTAAGDHPSGTDAEHGDASDAADVFHGCVNNNGCADSTKPVCQADAGVCVGCLANGDCKASGAHACDQTANKCVECVVNSDCTDPTKPVCDKQACRSCKIDSECAGVGPGVCMFHLDGHCATDSETVYVAKAGCANTPDGGVPGTSQTPYCTSQLGIDATKPTSDAGTSTDAGDPSDGGDSDAGPPAAKTLVVMRGPTPLAAWTFNSPGQTVTVVGQTNAMITPGASIGIHVSGGTIYIRGLRVTGSTSDIGVVANGGEIHVDRCTIDTNLGGMLVDGAAYDITNTVIASNSVNTVTGGCGGWGGVCIMHKPAGALGRFLNDTVVGNDAVGVTCDIAYPLTGSIIVPKQGGNPVAVCALTSCCGSGPINLDSTYRLMAGSSCIDKLPANMSTAYDIDGDPRPFGTLSDCGADEYTGP